MFSKKKKAAQGEFWVATHQLPTSAKGAFYSRLDETLESFGFGDKVRALCAPAYRNSNSGRPGIDPVVYLKMIMVGFFEDLPSERAIAARCADSMSIRSDVLGVSPGYWPVATCPPGCPHRPAAGHSHCDGVGQEGDDGASKSVTTELAVGEQPPGEPLVGDRRERVRKIG